MKRAQFLKTSCTACALFALPGITTLLFSNCASLPIFKTSATINNQSKFCIIDLSKFDSSNMLLLRLKNYEFDFIVIKKSDLQYSTFELRCTHEAQPLTASNKHIFCASHGSVFDFEGNALKQPATRPLTSYKTDILNHQLIIYLN